MPRSSTFRHDLPDTPAWSGSCPTEDATALLRCSGRVIKAALAAGFYPSLLRVDHPPARFRATEGGAVQVCSLLPNLVTIDPTSD